MSNFSNRLTRIEQSRLAVVASFPAAGGAREKLAALVQEHGGRLPEESLAMATARVLGIPTSELMAHLRERANA